MISKTPELAQSGSRLKNVRNFWAIEMGGNSPPKNENSRKELECMHKQKQKQEKQTMSKARSAKNSPEDDQPTFRELKPDEIPYIELQGRLGYLEAVDSQKSQSNDYETCFINYRAQDSSLE